MSLKSSVVNNVHVQNKSWRMYSIFLLVYYVVYVDRLGNVGFKAKSLHFMVRFARGVYFKLHFLDLSTLVISLTRRGKDICISIKCCN